MQTNRIALSAFLFRLERALSQLEKLRVRVGAGTDRQAVEALEAAHSIADRVRDEHRLLLRALAV